MAADRVGRNLRRLRAPMAATDRRGCGCMGSGLMTDASDRIRALETRLTAARRHRHAALVVEYRKPARERNLASRDYLATMAEIEALDAQLIEARRERVREIRGGRSRVH